MYNAVPAKIHSHTHTHINNEDQAGGNKRPDSRLFINLALGIANDEELINMFGALCDNVVLRLCKNE